MNISKCCLVTLLFHESVEDNYPWRSRGSSKQFWYYWEKFDSFSLSVLANDFNNQTFISFSPKDLGVILKALLCKPLSNSSDTFKYITTTKNNISLHLVKRQFQFENLLYQCPNAIACSSLFHNAISFGSIIRLQPILDLATYMLLDYFSISMLICVPTCMIKVCVLEVDQFNERINWHE